MAVNADANTDREKLVEKIRKLVAKANGTSNENESLAFMAKAQELMMLHEIADRELRDAGKSEFGIFRLDHRHLKNSAFGVALVASNIAELHGAKVILMSHPWADSGITGKRFRDGYFLEVFATESQMEIINMWLDYLIPQLQRMILTDLPSSRTTYAAAWGNRVAGRIKVMIQEAYSGGNALVPTSDAVNKAIVDKYPGMRLRPVSPNSIKPNSADYSAGREAGNRTDLRQHRLNDGHARLNR